MHLPIKVATVIAIALLTASLTLMTIPVEAQVLPLQNSGGVQLPAGVTADINVKTTAYLSFRPNPVGAGQTILVNMWITPAFNAYRYGSGYIVTITKPDGTKDTKVLDSYYGDATAWFEYVVDQVGSWKLKFNYPGGYYPIGNYCRPGQPSPPGYTTVAAGTTADRYGASYQSCYYQPSSTAEQTLTVQQEPVLSWPPAPLPTVYWTRPVQSELREWTAILGDYPWGSGPGGGPNWPAETNIYASNYRFIPYVQGPNTSHIVWSRQNAISGMIGAGTGLSSFETGSGNPSIIYQGRCYQTITKTMPTLVNGSTYNLPVSVWRCYDLRTGEIYWEQTGITQPPTLIEYYLGTGETPGAEAGAFNMGMYLDYIGSGRLIKYDPWTGAANVNVSIAPLTTGTYYMNGYALSVQTLGSTYRLINWTTLGPTTNITQRITGNRTWPWSSLGTSCDYNVGVAATVSPITPAALGAWYGTNVMAASLTTGQLLWNITVDDSIFSPTATAADHGKVATCMRDGYWMCWDLNSGKQLWKSEVKDYPWGIWSAYGVSSAYGLLYDTTYAGVYAFNWTNGKIAWNFKSPTPTAYETPYSGEYSFRGTPIIADGKLYTQNTEHTPSQPIVRGWRLFCINATSGAGIWNMTGEMTPGAVADGYITGSNTYDGTMYVFGKGKTATTVTAPTIAVAKGTSVLIQGTVLDMSPGQPGTPCVSKESMTIYMEYLHMQKQIPSGYTVTGVPVTLVAIDSTGNSISIGTITSDASGSFQMAWMPQAEGVYKVTATFAGDDSYGSSWAETGLSVGPAPAAIQFPQQITPPDYTMTIVGGMIAVIIAVAIVGILLYRKK